MMQHCKFLKWCSIMWPKVQKVLLHHNLSDENFNKNPVQSPEYLKMDQFFPLSQTQNIIPVHHPFCQSMHTPKLMINLWSFVATKPVGSDLKYLCNHYNPHGFRVELLLDLAFLSLQLQQHQTASDCLKELRATDVTVRLSVSSQSASFLSCVVVCVTPRSGGVFLKVGQSIMMECVQCELELNKHREGMQNYSRSSVEVLILLYSSLSKNNV